MSAATMSIKNFNSTLKMEDKGIPLPPPLPPLSKAGKAKQQGIMSILGSDNNKAAAVVSIRRTLSADMSSKKWLSQNGFFSPMKKIASSEELANLGQDDVWKSIQNSSKKAEPITSVDVWSSILTQKKDDSSATVPPPYIHPLLKKSSSLTEKSLEICTESLGSETGSEINLSSYPPSESDDDKDDHQQQQEFISHSFEEFPVVKYNHNKRSSSTPKSFPPPISSLAAEDKPSVHMQSHRQNGRLILEAVSVPSQNLFRTQRVDGRLLLTLISTNPTSETEDNQEVAEFEKVFDEMQEVEYNEPPQLDYDGDDGDEEEDEYEEEDEDEEEEEVEEKENGTKGMQIVLEQKPRLSNGRMNVNTSTLMMKQLMGLEKKNHHLKWSNKENEITQVPHSLPPISQLITSSPNPPSAAASFNAYEYFWRKNPTIVNNYNDDKQVVVSAPNSTTPNANGTTTKITSYEQKDLVLIRGNKGNINNLVPLLKGCKEPRRSLLIWEPHCIATS
ncbi:protein FAF-like, chloroplastic [Nicotiana tomentosiformis]|uniref:protein FAF-like, chloroplastic n=1 Tax=Nicotiana tomentosiformis TaxID=4098 RepID=UPI00051ACA9A|nr:protein FAF-like, chloroplastic isoform X1 [Nicotiana tomentosiformis]